MKIKRVLAQLQERRVTRVAAIYAAAAWALLQVADVMFPIIGLSEDAITMVLLLALAGFPLSLVLSWVFDFNVGGVTQTSDADIEREVERFHLTPTRLAAILASGLLFLSVGYLYLERLSEDSRSLFEEEEDRIAEAVTTESGTTPGEDGGRPSIAVLPFVNFSDVADMEHFGDGMAEEILNLLAKLDELRVAARTSSFYFKNRNLDVREIARHLGVRYVLEGSVRHSGSAIRVTAQLIDASNGFHLWSETYDRTPSNVFNLQDEISREVVARLQVILSNESAGVLARDLDIDPDAYDLYLRGRDYLRRPNDTSAINNAERLFRRATQISPDYADAFAGLCDTLLIQYANQFEKASYDAAEAACQRAQALDSRSPAVHIALGNLYRVSGQFALAEREFNRALSLKSTAVDSYLGLAETYVAQEKYGLAEQTLVRALELEPNHWSTPIEMGVFLVGAGRPRESIPYFERVDELLPESNAAATNLGTAYYLLGEIERAATAWEAALEDQPTDTLYANLGTSYFFLGRFDDAAAMYEKVLTLAPENFEAWGNLAEAYKHSTTQAGKAPATYQQAVDLAQQHLRINPSDAFTVAALAHYHASLGEREAAIRNIELAQELAQKDMYVYYFLALALCALDEQERAIELIAKALALGYPAHLVGMDAGLASLKGLPSYETIIAEAASAEPDATTGENTP